MKRAPSSPTVSYAATKKPRLPGSDNARKQSRIASADDAARVDADPPYNQLLRALATTQPQTNNAKIGCVVYWMRMEDMRIFDNRALSRASEHAQRTKTPLVALFVHSPEDYVAHDRGARRIDFVMRNLKVLHRAFDSLNIPFVIEIHTPRRTLPEKVASLMAEWGAGTVYANIEHEVDELRRDLRLLALFPGAKFVHDRCVVPPGQLETKQGKQYAVYGPWLKQWTPLERAADPTPNDRSVRDGPFKSFFGMKPVDVLEGFECEDAQEMEDYWPAGTDAALKASPGYTIVERFLRNGSTPEQLGETNPLRVELGTFEPGGGDVPRIDAYDENRNHADRDTTARISPYLAAGVIPTRALIRLGMEHAETNKMDASRGSGTGVWTMELAWRDFYTHVMAAFPRVSMGRPYLEKYADVKWETNEEHLQAWKDGMTGVPIVDAGMRQLKKHGWMHNRLDLMIDWRLGEMHFSHLLIDADLASNNGGWQWSASTGTDPQPYFRIFNPYLQAEKADPTGDFIRHYVTELKGLRGKALYDPATHLDKATFAKLQYPRPIVKHSEVKDRAIHRYKNVGEE
ncbi:hypothetical protein EXIGLDRAFT_737781 [Exidia glandulosa HHB12029]|uniref:Photolyase/cryptochrome alpha/beta domain-containing protein n=1 Tax=Exidia glandulosa HHB12029 TaxID=1314781 RepID=A0A165QU57_EXIGL|nr:hypothetical protein EXIGLDRAFT_737781 [Exidia glandulosa HHB12029]